MRASWYAQFALSTLIAVIGFLLTPADSQNPYLGLFLVVVGFTLMALALSQFYWKDEVRPAQDLAFAQRILGIRDEIILSLRGVPNVTGAQNAACELTNVATEISPELKTANPVYWEPPFTMIPPTRNAPH